MDTALVERYRARRAAGAYASLAYAQAIDSSPILEWRGGTARWAQEGFELVASVELDEGPDLSYLGEWSHSWSEGAIPHDQDDPRTSDWFTPAITADQHYRGLRELKYGRSEARRLSQRYVRQDYSRALAYGDGWWTVFVTVIARRNAIELGRAILGGIESDSGDDYFSRVAQELAAEAIDEAKSAIAGLCTG